MTEQLIAGVDEVGRGPLAGPVVAAAVILDPKNPIEGLMDSKKLSAKKREQLAVLIHERALACSIARAEIDEIDQINILHASLLAMQRAVETLDCAPDLVQVDGNRVPKLAYPAQAIIKGDQLIPAISAASIIAKVYRDHEMTRLHELYPEYGFAKHKGYPTKQHLAALAEFGVSEIHRMSFAPCRKVVCAD